MSANFMQSLRGTPARRVNAAEVTASGFPSAAASWQVPRLAERACCCPAKPAVVAMLPPPSGRTQPVDLQLCMHHYRASRRSLQAAGATVFDGQGTPI